MFIITNELVFNIEPLLIKVLVKTSGGFIFTKKVLYQKE